MKKIILSLILTFSLLSASTSLAAFNPNLIISDYEFEDYTSMSQLDIQRFLQKKGSTLADYVDPKVKVTAAQLIYDNAILNQINPKVLLTTLQKEQSLITDTSPLEKQYDWATGYAICDDCSKSDPSLARFKGFANQIDYAASSFRFFIDRPLEYGFQVGKTERVDGQSITVANAATHALLNYTPHLHGNQNFYNIWQDWFTNSYPDGSLLQDAQSGGIFLIQNGTKRPFSSKVALVSRYNPTHVITVSPEDLESYVEGPPIRYAQYSLLRSPQGTVYLIRGEKKHGITSGEVMRRLGFNPEEIIDLKQSEIDSIPEGEPISTSSAYPTGALLKDPISGGIWYAEHGLRHAIWSPEILKANFSQLVITPTDEVTIGTLKLGSPVMFEDGQLVKSDTHPDVYVISNRKKRPIASEKAFNTLGYKWTNILVTSDKALSLHPLGDAIDTENEGINTASTN